MADVKNFYLPEGPGPFPLVCQTPLLGRIQFLDDLHFEKQAALYFASKGLACAIMERPIFEFDPQQGLDQLPRYLEESIHRNESTLRELLKDPRVDKNRVGTFGMSFGSMVNCLWAARNPLLKAHVVALGGTNFADIFVTSRDPLMMSHQRAAYASTGMDRQTLLDELRKEFKKDLLKIHNPFTPDSCLLVLALFDQVVRFEYGLELKKALGNPPTLFLPLGHYTAILALPFLRWQAARFFKKKLGTHAPA